jgi:hypothetical protein
MFNSNQAFLFMQKLKSAPPKSFTLPVKVEIEKIFSNLPLKLLINAEFYDLVLLAPRLKKTKKKRIPLNLGSQFATLVANF